MSDAGSSEEEAIICHRCGAMMKGGGALFYVVRIESFPLPEAPRLSEEELGRDFSELLAELLEEMRGLSSRELMDQVYRRMTLHLCPSCYARWIEDPTG